MVIHHSLSNIDVESLHFPSVVVVVPLVETVNETMINSSVEEKEIVELVGTVLLPSEGDKLVVSDDKTLVESVCKDLLLFEGNKLL